MAKTKPWEERTHVNWLISCPASDGNFRLHLRQASEEEIGCAIDLLIGKDGTKSKVKALEGELSRREKLKARIPHC